VRRAFIRDTNRLFVTAICDARLSSPSRSPMRLGGWAAADSWGPREPTPTGGPTLRGTRERHKPLAGAISLSDPAPRARRPRARVADATTHRVTPWPRLAAVLPAALRDLARALAPAGVLGSRGWPRTGDRSCVRRAYWCGRRGARPVRRHTSPLGDAGPLGFGERGDVSPILRTGMVLPMESATDSPRGLTARTARPIWSRTALPRTYSTHDRNRSVVDGHWTAQHRLRRCAREMSTEAARGPVTDEKRRSLGYTIRSRTGDARVTGSRQKSARYS
jgi:hypothetical protein